MRKNLTRRALLTSTIGILVSAADLPMHIQMRPESPPTSFSLAMDDTLLRIRFDGDAATFELPALRARVLSLLPIADREVMVVAFGVDRAPAITQELIAIIGWDGQLVRILGIESLSWHRADGSDLALRLFATADRRRLLLSYMATTPRRSATDLVHASWNDFLAWQDDSTLVDSPPRPPIPGSRQRFLADIRARVAAVLATPTFAVSPASLDTTGLLQPLSV